MGMVLRNPFRLLAALLLLVLAAEIWGILHTPTYGAELSAAKAAYETALAEHEALKKEALAGASRWRD